MSGKELQEKNSKSNKLAALFFNKGSNKVDTTFLGSFEKWYL